MTAEEAAGKDLALMKYRNKRGDDVLVLYNVKNFTTFVTEESKNEPEPSVTEFDIIVGFISYGDNRDGGKAYDAKEVRQSAAQQGFGPVMYDLAMEDAGSLMSDRESVSDSAEKIWTYFYNKRDDVLKMKLDNVFKPETDTEEDDAVIFADVEDVKVKDKSGEEKKTKKYTRKREPLNYAYMSSNATSIADLKSAHKKLMNMLHKSVRADVNDMEAKLHEMGHVFFWAKYRK